MSAQGLTPEELKRPYDEKTLKEARTFETKGVSRQAALDYLETPEGQLYRQRLIEAAPDTPVSEIRRRAIDQITSGRELPRMEMLDEPLVKIVPKGQTPSPFSPFWAKEADLDAAIQEGRNLSHHFALPVTSESPRYDVYRITPKAPTEVFVNTVAPTSELDGQVSKPGGARQYLTPNRQLYEPHEFVKTVDNRLHLPVKGHGIRPAVKTAGVLGTAYGAVDAKSQVDAAIATARSNREQWVRGYEYISKEGRLLRQVNGLKEELQHSTEPAERARLQTRLDAASAAFGKEAERNGRYFEGRAGVDKGWEQMHARFPKVDKDDVNEALARHIDAGKQPRDAVRGAYSDAVHGKYPRALPHEPLENYRALSDEQLAQKHRQYVGEVAQGRRTVEALQSNKDSHNNVDQGWPKALAQQRQAGRVQQGANELWRDIGHLGAIREVYKERGLPPPELPAELKPRAAQTERIAMVQEGAPVSDFSVREAQSRSSEQHLTQAHQAAHAQTQEPARTAEAPAAPSRAAPERAMA